MAQIEKSQIRDIYALGASLGMVDKGQSSHDDALHSLVMGITGKVGVSELNQGEATQVITELINRMRLNGNTPAKSNPRQDGKASNGMTEGQQQKVWHLMYELKNLDTARSTATLGERLCGIIKKEIGFDATSKEPFKWLNYTHGSLLIEALKRYVSSAGKKKLRSGDG